MKNSGTNLWMGSILQDILNNVLKEARSLTIFHKAPLSLHISFFFCGFIIRLRWTNSSLPTKAYFCSAVDLCLLEWKPLETPTTLYLSVHSSLHHWLSSSHAYLLIKLQGLPPHGDGLARETNDNTMKENCTQMVYITIGFQNSTNAEIFFFSGSSFLTWLLPDGLRGLSELLLSEQECNISTVK